MKQYNFTRVNSQHFKVTDEINYPVGEVKNTNFTIVITIPYPMDYKELMHLLQTIEQERENGNLDIGYGKYAIEMKH